MRLNGIVENRTTLILGALFAASVLSKAFIIPTLGAVWFPYSDEHLYIEMARCLYYQHNMVSTVFSHIPLYNEFLFPLILSPLYVFYSPEHILTVFRFFGLAAMSTVVFPAYALGFAVLADRKQALLVSLFSILIPEMTLAFSVVQEVVYYPLVIHAFHLIYQKINGKNIHPAYLGFVFFLLWICKAIGVTIFGGYSLFVLGQFALSSKSRSDKNALLHWLTAGLVMAGLKIAFTVIIQYLNFGTLAIENDHYTNLFLLRIFASLPGFLSDFPNGVFYYLFYLTAAFMIFPVILPYDNLSRYDSPNRRFLGLLGLCLTGTIAVVVVLIYSDEGGAAVSAQRVHYRYFFPYLVPLLTMVLKLDFARLRIKLFGLLGFSFLFFYDVLFVPDFKTGSIIDFKSLLLWEKIKNAVINGNSFLVLLAAIFIISFVDYLHHNADGKLPRKVLVAAFLVILSASHVYAAIYTHRYYTRVTNGVDRSREYTALSQLVNPGPGTPLVIVPLHAFWLDSLVSTQSQKGFIHIPFTETALEYPLAPAVDLNYVILPRSYFPLARIRGAKFVETGSRIFNVFQIQQAGVSKIIMEYVILNTAPDGWVKEDARLLISGEGRGNQAGVTLNLTTGEQAGEIEAVLKDTTGKTTRSRVSSSGTTVSLTVNKKPEESNFLVSLASEGFFVPIRSEEYTGEKSGDVKLSYRITGVDIQ